MGIFSLEAEVHKPLKNKQGELFGYRVKLSLLDPDLGFFINGMVVCPPGDKISEWVVYTPKVGNARIIEFNGKESKLWPDIQAVCIDAVKEYLRHEKLDIADDTEKYDGLSKEEFDKQLLDDLTKAGF